MRTDLKNLLLKTIPFILSVIGGVIIFIISLDNVKDPNVSGLLDNVAASLLSIPLVFLLYDYTNYRISRQVNRTIANTVLDKTNSVMLSIAAVLRNSLGLRGRFQIGSFNKLQGWSLKKISGRLHISSKDMSNLRTYRFELDELLYRSSNGSVLSEDQAQVLLIISREISHLITESNFKHDKQSASKHIKKIIDGIVSWQEASISLSDHLEDIAGQAESESF